MKTIFITSFHVLISRNILATAAFRRLAEDPELRVVVYVPEGKREYFEQTFGGPQVVVEGVDGALGARDRWLRNLSLAALDSRTLAIKRRAEFAASQNYPRFFTKSALAWFAAGRSWSRRMLRLLDRLFAPRRRFDEHFRRYGPKLVFATDVQSELDLQILRSATGRGVPAVGMVRSWDNLTAKGIMRLIPDVLAVNNEIVKREAMTLNGVPEEKIRVVGIPHYDRYVGGPPSRRSEFFRRIGLDPSKRLVLVAPLGDRYVCEFKTDCVNRTDRYILETLLRAQADGRLPADLQFLVRLPPADSVNLDGFLPPPTMVVEQPGVGAKSGRIKEQELSADDDSHLIDSIAHANLIITGPSTMAIDAAVLGKPIVIANLEPEPQPYHESIRRFYDYDHFRPVMESGGVANARGPEELVAAVNAYLSHPDRDAVGRAKIASEECWRRDAKSSERLLAVIQEQLKKNGDQINE